MKTLFVVIFSFVIFTDAMEVTDEDINSPLVSYLLAKVQQLEAKMMAKPNIRNVREVVKRSIDTNTSADEKKTKRLPTASGHLRISDGVTLLVHMKLYKGTAVGGRYDHETSPSNLMCLPPTWMTYSDDQGGHDPVYAVEYEAFGSINHAHDRNMPCALCETTGRSAKIMIPSHYKCPDGWHKEYNGYIMAGYHSHHGGSMYNCIDKQLEQIPASGSSEAVHLLYTVYATGAHVPHNSSYSLSCVVCTK